MSTTFIGITFVFPPDLLVLSLNQILQLHLADEISLLVDPEDVSAATGGDGSRSSGLGGVPVVDGEDVPLAILGQAVVTVLEGLPELPDEFALLSEELEPPMKLKLVHLQ